MTTTHPSPRAATGSEQSAPIREPAFLTRPDGRVAYDIAGTGPLLVLLPGMGDLRASYRFLAPALVNAGYRVACTDLRGHGDSDTTFVSYGDQETAGDTITLIEELGEPAVVIGNSMGAGAAVLAAAQRPELVSGLVLIGPFVRNGQMSGLQRLLLRVAMARPWAAITWKAYLPKLYAGQRPADFDQYRDGLMASLRRPGYAKAFSLTTRTDHTPAQERLSDVSAPTLVVMGDQDPDFPDPRAEAEWIAQALNGAAVIVAEAGHYPQSQQPELTADAVLPFLETVHGRAPQTLSTLSAA
jgi:pimeloyl-ACP methyl ester carboxylesterase